MTTSALRMGIQVTQVTQQIIVHAQVHHHPPVTAPPAQPPVTAPPVQPPITAPPAQPPVTAA